MKKAFTLIELLIVVAIIAILAAIAVPNFLEAQMRAKIARSKNDMRSLATGLESYAVDWNKYPYCNNNITGGRRPDASGTIPATEVPLPILERISTPVAYVTNAFVADIFKPEFRSRQHAAGSEQGNNEAISATGIGFTSDYNVHWIVKYGSMDPNTAQTFGFANDPLLEVPKAWILYVGGPDRNYPGMGALASVNVPASVVCAQMYDATNGTVSYGDIYRVNQGALSRSGFAGELFSQATIANK
ncbi:MAG: prepilin-type N-terminal cleavage/methylation domain-containing protein [Candidatus Sumerlaeaceae bacterium]